MLILSCQSAAGEPVTELLLQQPGIELNRKDKYYKNALHYAASDGTFK